MLLTTLDGTITLLFEYMPCYHYCNLCSYLSSLDGYLSITTGYAMHTTYVSS